MPAFKIYSDISLRDIINMITGWSKSKDFAVLKNVFPVYGHTYKKSVELRIKLFGSGASSNNYVNFYLITINSITWMSFKFF